VHPELEPLVRQLAELSEAERRDVIAAAEQTVARRPVLPWEAWERARGVVKLGGNAVEDCERHYDGA